VWFARAFALAPPEAVARLLRHADVRLGQTVATLLRTATGWQATDADKAPLGEAPIVIIANAMAALRLLPQPLPMTAVRGQVSLVPQPLWRTVPRVGIAGDGFISALPGGDVCIGATFQRGDHDPRMRAADHAHNLMKAQRLLPQALPEIASDRLAGRVGWRACTPDRLPYAGRIAEGVFVLAGLGARGMLWAPLLAEQLAAEIADAPWPMARSLWARLAPGR
jgi:tRNA 5-methylaminomethyl-2-thiouridine biosynthesis bifunctional protein